MAFVRLFVLPIFRKHFLFHASVTHNAFSTPIQIETKGPIAYRIQQHIQQLVESLQNKFRIRVSQTWTDFENAKERSMKGRMYRLAQNILAREDPQETSLKEIPNSSQINKLQIIYPASFKEALVRRRLRLMLKQRRSIHRSSLIGWCFASLPFILLLVTPVPNLPLYYSVYRIYSNYFVFRNCESLDVLLKEYNSQKIPHRQTGQCGKLDTSEWRVEFKACEKLEEILEPHNKLHHPLSDEAVLHLATEYTLPGILQVVARARRKATGAMFPHEFSTSN